MSVPGSQFSLAAVSTCLFSMSVGGSASKLALPKSSCVTLAKSSLLPQFSWLWPLIDEVISALNTSPATSASPRAETLNKVSQN